MKLGLCFFLLAVGAIHCGYHAVNSQRLFGFDTVAVVPFGEEFPIGLSAQLATRLCGELAAGGIHLVGDEKIAPAVIVGRIIRATSSASPVASRANIPAYDLTVEFEAELRDQSKRTLWHKAFLIREDFLSVTTLNATGDVNLSDPTLATETNRRRALTRIAETAAREIVNALRLDAAWAEGKP